MKDGFFDRLQVVIATKKISQKALGEKIGVHEQTVSRWRKSEPDLKNIVAICDATGANMEWLRDGEGPMFATGEGKGKYSSDVSAENNHNAEAENDGRKQKWTSTKIDLAWSEDGDPPLSMDDLMNMCEVVLESKTVYRPALASNLRAFYKAVREEGEVNRLSDELEKTNKRLANIENLLEQFVASQKRDHTPEGGKTHSA